MIVEALVGIGALGWLLSDGESEKKSPGLGRIDDKDVKQFYDELIESAYAKHKGKYLPVGKYQLKVTKKALVDSVTAHDPIGEAVPAKSDPVIKLLGDLEKLRQFEFKQAVPNIGYSGAYEYLLFAHDGLAVRAKRIYKNSDKILLDLVGKEGATPSAPKEEKKEKKEKKEGAKPKMVTYEHSCADSSTYHNRKYKHWAKVVKRIDDTKSNGYAFEGDFISSTSQVRVKATDWILEYLGCKNRYYFFKAQNPEETIIKGGKSAFVDFIDKCKEAFDADH